MNIAMFGHKYVPSREGGIEVVVEELSMRMVQQGHQVTCFNRGGYQVDGKGSDRKRRQEYMGIRLKKVPTIPYRGLAAVSSSVLATVFVSFGNYDVVHIHAEGPAFMCWLPKFFGKRVIVTIHGLDHKRAKWGKLASAYIMAGERSAVRFADEIIVLSENMQNYFAWTYKRKTVYIPNGVGRKENRPADRITKNWGIEKDGYVLYLGRLVPEKGIHYLIEAFKQCKTNKKLVIAGKSSDTDEYEQKIRKMAEGDNRIIFTGFVQGRVKHELYSNAYLYVLPSDLEGMPLTVLESMSYGNCCLVSDIRECAEVVEDRMITFKRGNITDLKDKLQELLDDEEAVQKYKSGAEKFILEKYNWDKVVNKTLELYQKPADVKKMFSE